MEIPIDSHHFFQAKDHLLQAGFSWLMLNLIFLVSYLWSSQKAKAKKVWLRINLFLIIFFVLVIFLLLIIPAVTNISLEVRDTHNLSSKLAKPIKFWQENTLIISKDFMITPCSSGIFPIVIGTYQVKGDKINIGYRTFFKDPACACMCVKRITYRIPDLQHQDYDVVISH